MRLLSLLLIQAIIFYYWFTKSIKIQNKAGKIFWTVILLLFFGPLDLLYIFCSLLECETLFGLMIFMYISPVVAISGFILAVGAVFVFAKWVLSKMKSIGIRDYTLPGNTLLWVVIVVVATILLLPYVLRKIWF